MCSQSTNVDISNLIEGQLTNKLHGKEVDEFVVLTEQKVKVNWSTAIFNNIYNKLQDLSTLTKPNVRKDNTEFKVAQMVNISL